MTASVFMKFSYDLLFWLYQHFQNHKGYIENGTRHEGYPPTSPTQLHPHI
jgi:hypothetical protein